MKRPRSRRTLCSVVAGGLAIGFLSAFSPPTSATTTPADDAPVLLNPKGEHDTGADDASWAKLQDAYYASKLTSGDNPISIGQAASLRGNATSQANAIASASQQGAARGGTWAAQGPTPIVQVGRTTNTFEAVAGRVSALAIRKDGTIILGAAQGGVWTYDQTTKLWTSRTSNSDTQAVGSLAVAPSDDNVVYLGSGEGALAGDAYSGNGVYRSTDGGMTFSHVSSLFTGQAVSDIAVDPTNANHLYVTTLRGRGGAHRTTAPTQTPYGVWESTDGGSNWTLRKGTTDENHAATNIVMDPQNPQLLWASFWGDGIYRSTDGGLHWSSAMGNLAPGNYLAQGSRFALGISHPANQAQATIYTGFDYLDAANKYHPSQVYKTTDGGTTWTATATGSGSNSIMGYCGTQCYYDNEIKPDPTNPNVVYVLGLYGYTFSPPSGGVWRSADGGATWKNLGYDLHPDYHAFAFQPNNTQHVALGNDGGVWQSLTGGGRNGASDPLSAADWEDLNGTVNPSTGALVHSTGLQIAQFTSISTVPQVPGQYWGGTQDNGTLRKSLANNRWFDQSSGDGGQVIVDQSTTNPLNPKAAAYVFGTYYGISPYRFDPSETGTIFGNETIDGGINKTDRSEFYVPWVQNGGNVNQMFLGTYRLYRSNNVEAPASADVNFTPISGDLTTGCTGTAPNGARACVTSAIGLADGGTGVYAGTDDGVMSVSPDAVTSNSPTWTRVGQGQLPNRPVNQIAVDKSNWRVAYAAYSGFGAATPTNRGHVFATSDGGTHWTDISSNLPDIPVNSVVLDPSSASTLYVGTDVGSFVTINGGQTWKRLGDGIPKVSVWQLNYDPSHGVLVAGTHGRGAYTLTNRSPLPALEVSKTDSGAPVGPGSTIDYTITVKNIGNAAATGVAINEPIPTYTSFGSAANGGSYGGGQVRWGNLTVPAGGSLAVHFSVRISSTLPATASSIVNDGIRVMSDQGVGTTGSPHSTPIAPAHSVSIDPTAQSGGAKVGQSVSYTETLTNHGYLSDSYVVSATGAWTSTVYDSSCTTPITTTPAVAPGASTNVCVKVDVPASAANDARSDTAVTAASTGDPTAHAAATLTSIAVAVDTLVVDNDNNAPNVAGYYQAALDANGAQYSTWDLSANPALPQSYLLAHSKVVWFTGNSYPNPVGPYESELKAFLDGGGRLFMSGQDILDQAAGTAPFVRDYLHIGWDGSERQNDQATSTVTAVAGNPVTDGLGQVALNHSVLNAAFEDQITPISPAASAFTDDTGATDGLSVAAGSYKVVFLAFPFEAYGNASNQSALMGKVLGYFNN